MGHKEKIVFGIIMKKVEDIAVLTSFLENASKFGHLIDKLIIVYQFPINIKIIKKLEKYCEIFPVQAGKSSFLTNSLKRVGLENKEISYLLNMSTVEKYETIAYGTSRNHVLLAAIFLGAHYLCFFDADVFPKILKAGYEKQYFFEEIDFVGSHLKYLKQNKNIVVTTSDYTGYFIIPGMDFTGLDKLLFGLQKEADYEFIATIDAPIVQEKTLQNIFKTDKVLGGNLAINLNKVKMVPPFFSTNLVIDNECIKGRGEDTAFAPLINKNNGICMDIDLLIFHNCFGDFPNKPDIKCQKNIDRFYYACIGWIIRNPFYNWLNSIYIGNKNAINKKERFAALEIGSKAAVKYFNDKRFFNLPKAFNMAYAKLDKDIESFQRLLKIWSKIQNYYSA